MSGMETCLWVLASVTATHWPTNIKLLGRQVLIIIYSRGKQEKKNIWNEIQQHRVLSSTKPLIKIDIFRKLNRMSFIKILHFHPWWFNTRGVTPITLFVDSRPLPEKREAALGLPESRCVHVKANYQVVQYLGATAGTSMKPFEHFVQILIKVQALACRFSSLKIFLVKCKIAFVEFYNITSLSCKIKYIQLKISFKKVGRTHNFKAENLIHFFVWAHFTKCFKLYLCCLSRIWQQNRNVVPSIESQMKDKSTSNSANCFGANDHLALLFQHSCHKCQ